MESRFGYDFGNVKIHTDEITDNYAQKFNATAFVLGNHIFFGDGEYHPHSHRGRHLIAHELTHVIQGNKSVIARQPIPPPGQLQPQVPPKYLILLIMRNYLNKN